MVRRSLHSFFFVQHGTSSTQCFLYSPSCMFVCVRVCVHACVRACVHVYACRMRVIYIFSLSLYQLFVNLTLCILQFPVFHPNEVVLPSCTG